MIKIIVGIDGRIRTRCDCLERVNGAEICRECAEKLSVRLCLLLQGEMKL
jgi:hypothetical protein